MSDAPGDSAGWSAQLLDPAEAGDARRIEALRADPAVTVLDAIAAQREQLRSLLPPPSPQLLDEPTRWAWYPWRRTLIHVLGPAGYRRARLDRNRNKITAAEQERLGRLRIGVVGLSVGHAIAHTLAMQGLAGMLRLADFDDIEVTNLNRIPATLFDLGVNKAVAAGRRIAELDPYLPVEAVTEGLTDETMARFAAGLDVIVEECDSLDMKLAVRAAARGAGIALIMETSDRGLLDVERYDLEPQRPLFHGLLGAAAPADLRGLSTHDKVPHVLRILEPAQLSARMAASMTEVDVTLSTWPQLSGDVALGAASVAAAVTRIGRGSPLTSGRTRIDLEQILDGLHDPAAGSPAGPGSAGRHRAGRNATPRAGGGPDGAAQATTPRAGAGPAEAGQAAGQAGAGPTGGAAGAGQAGAGQAGGAAGEDLSWLAAPADPRRAIAHAAQLAPSGGNAQPWELSLDAAQLGICVAPHLGVRMNVAFRASYVTLGAALFNARVAAASRGLLGEARVEPVTGAGPDEPAVRAALRFGSGADPGLGELYPLVLARSTNRRLGDGAPLGAAVLDELRAAAALEGGGLAAITGPQAMAAIAELIGESDRIRYLTPPLHADLMAELRWPGEDDLARGLDVRTLELDEADLAKLQVARRGDVMEYLERWGAGRALGDDSRDRLATAGAYAVVTTTGTEPADYVRGGQALQRMWLAATRLGIGVHPMSPVYIFAQAPQDCVSLSPAHAAELARMNGLFRSLMGIARADSAVLALRLSRPAGPPSVRSARLPLDAVLENGAAKGGAVDGGVLHGGAADGGGPA
jgi:nitroreductase